MKGRYRNPKPHRYVNQKDHGNKIFVFRRTDENGVWMEHNPLLEPVQEVFVHFGLLLKWRKFKGQAPAVPRWHAGDENGPRKLYGVG